MTVKFGSLFSGIGGFDLGFERAGMTCAWQCEIDKRASKVLAHHWPDVKRYQDVRTIGAHNLEPVDLICGGFPCQDVSVAGRRAGLAGERSGLWHEFRRILEECRPGWAVIENVPGLLSSNSGRDFAVILHGLAELGYGVCWRVLDAQYFGLAQRRRRVFIVASLGDGRAAEVLFEREGGGWNTAPSREAGARTPASAIASTLNSGGNDGGFRTEPGEQLVAPALTNPIGKGGFADPVNDGIIATLQASGAGTPRPAGMASEPDFLITGTLPADYYKQGGNGMGEMENGIIAFAQNQRDEVRDLHNLAGAVAAEPGMKQQTYVTHTLRAEGHDASEDGTGRGVPIVFDTTQITSPGNYSNPQPGDPCHPLASGAHPPAVVLSLTERTRNGERQAEWQEDLAYSLNNPGDGGRAQERLIAFTTEQTPKFRDDQAFTLTKQSPTGGGHQMSIAGNFGVRRLMPVECERLQGFPDGWTDGQADSSRYRQLGNAVAVPCAEWLGRRILAIST